MGYRWRREKEIEYFFCKTVGYEDKKKKAENFKLFSKKYKLHQSNPIYMKNRSLLILSISILFASCGPSAEEVAQQQRQHDDSVAAVTAQRVEQKNKLESKLKEFKEELVKNKAALEAAKDKMNQIKDFHFLRTSDEREQQVRQQSEYISKLEENVNILTQNISTVENNLANL